MDWMDMQDDPRDEGRPATGAEAHVEWHLNSGVPMGQPCPWDACDPGMDPEVREESHWEHEMRDEPDEPDEPPCTDPRPDPRTHPEYWTE